MKEERRESQITLSDVERIALQLTPLADAWMQDFRLEMLANEREILSAIFLYNNNQSPFFQSIPTRLLMRKPLGRGSSSFVHEVRLPNR